jgi:hypothetical protein
MVTAKVESQKLARRLGKKSEVVSFGFLMNMNNIKSVTPAKDIYLSLKA